MKDKIVPSHRLNRFAGSAMSLEAAHTRYVFLISVGVLGSLVINSFGLSAMHRCPSYLVSTVNLSANDSGALLEGWYLLVASSRTALPTTTLPSVAISFSGHTFTNTPSTRVQLRLQYWETTLLEGGIRDRSPCTMKNELFSGVNAFSDVEYASLTPFWFDVSRHHVKRSLKHMICL